MKQILDAKVWVYYGLGFVSLGLSVFLGRHAAFADQDFFCGMLLGGAILLLLHGVYFCGRNIANISQQKK